jgi:hypothetical protein
MVTAANMLQAMYIAARLQVKNAFTTFVSARTAIGQP